MQNLLFGIRNRVCSVNNFGFGIQKFVNPFHRSRCLLSQRSNPTDGGHGPRQHTHVNHKFRNVAGRNVAFHDLQAAHVNRDDGTCANHQKHDGKKCVVNFRQIQGFCFKNLTLLGKMLDNRLFSHVTFHDSNARIRLLCGGVERRQLLLNFRAASLDLRRNVINGDDQKRQRQQTVKRERGTHFHHRIYRQSK